MSLAAAAALVLAGCGGGGGGTSATPASLQSGTSATSTSAAIATGTGAPTATTPATSPSTPATTGGSAATPAAAATAGNTVAAATPAMVDPLAARTVDLSAVRAAVLQVLQDERQRCGFSPLAQDANLDQAATSHGAYLANDISNGVTGAHTERPGSPGFTGASATDRAVAAGYTPGAVNEAFVHTIRAPTDASIAAATAATARAAAHTRFLLSTVYHMQTLLAPRRDLGVGYAEQKGSTAFAQVTVMEMGVKSASSNAPQTDLLTYPCQGTTAVAGAFVPSTETPNPLPGVADATVGTPLFLRAPEGKVLVLRSYSVAGPDGIAVAATVLDAANDPVGYLTSAQAFVVPQQPLVSGATYKVSFSGTVDGTAFTRSFTFKPT